MKARWEIVLCVVAFLLSCLVGCSGSSTVQSPVQESGLQVLAEGLTEGSEPMELRGGVTGELSPLEGGIFADVDVLLAASAAEEPAPAIFLHRRLFLLERILDRLNRIIERGQIAEAEKAKILERVRTRLETSLSDDEKARILERVEARINRVIEQGRLAEQRKPEILGRAEAATARAVEEGRLTEERRAEILQQIEARIDAVIERGRNAEEQKAQILENVRARLEAGLSDEEKAQILQRVEAWIDRMIEEGRLAEQRKAEILEGVEARLDELVSQGIISAEQKELILQRLTD